MKSPTDSLCLACGLCCNGVLFADVRPEPDDPSPLFAGRQRVAQPCPAFQTGDCTCQIYPQRPKRCRQFECRQLLAVKAGEATASQALKKIQKARKLVAQLEKNLEKLGFNELKLPLTRRFQKCQRAAEHGELAGDNMGRLADTQLTMHRLTMLLAEEFYG